MNKKIKSIPAVFFLISIIAFSCKKSENSNLSKNPSKNSAVGYVLKEGVCFHKEPKISNPCEKSRILGSPFQLEIMEHNIDPIGNDPRKIKFYKAKWNQEIGYISYQEELDKKSFYAIEKWDSPKKAKVNVSSLRFRALPSLEARNIRPLTRGTDLEILGMGLIKFQADGKYDAWAMVRDSDGVEGFSFAGFLDILNDSDESIASREFSGTGESGFVFLKDIPELSKDLDETQKRQPLVDLEKIKRMSCNEDCVAFNYTDRVEKEGRTFFYVKKQYIEYGINYMDHGTLHEGWIDSSFVQAHGENLWEYTVSKIQDKNILKIINYLKSESNIKNAFDVNIIDQITGLDGSGTYYVVEFYEHDNDYNRRERLSKVFLLQDNNLRLILSYFDQIKYQDLNGDGVYEWLTTSSGRSDWNTILYGNINGIMEEKIRLYDSEYEGCSYSLDGSDRMIKLGQAEEYDQKKCNLELKDSGELQIDHGLGLLKFKYIGNKLVKI